MAYLFTVTLFLSAALLFLIQPLVARRLLPLLGGSPGVWNTCLVFYQSLLLAGYAAAHWLPRWLGLKRHALLHLGLIGLGCLFLPPRLPAEVQPPESAFPVDWLLQTLALMLGVPFLVLSSTGPLLQRWYAASGQPNARDPYFLYAASNLGSLLALLAYPLLLEPFTSLSEQAVVWSAGYVFLVILTWACYPAIVRAPSVVAKPIHSSGPPISRWRYARWVLLTLAPSSLMLSVTTYLTADVASMPLLWVIPLSLYLLSFTMVFARRQLLPHRVLVRVLPLVMVALIIALLSEATEPLWLLLPLHLLGLFVIAMVCHGELARDRPAAEHLTAFYLSISLGGVLGGLFTGLVAPLLFKGIAEYPLALVLACLLRVQKPRAGDDSPWLARQKPGTVVPGSRFAWRDFVLPMGLCLLMIAMSLAARELGAELGHVLTTSVAAAGALLAYLMSDRPLRFALGVAAVFIGGSLLPGVHGVVLDQRRDFFGVHRVTLDATGEYRQLVHGNTVHGRQKYPPETEPTPLAYFHPRSPIAGVMAAVANAKPQAKIAIVGLGAGSLAAYGKKGQEITYYEIDPTVEQLAKKWFSYLKSSDANLEYVIGDARLKLQGAKSQAYDLIVIDAFSSDAIPVHLLTAEALALYRSKLAPGGLLVLHVSNRYLRLERVASALARDVQLPCWFAIGEEDTKKGWDPSHWVAIAEDNETLRTMLGVPWGPLPYSTLRAWTDDYSSVLGILK